MSFLNSQTAPLDPIVSGICERKVVYLAHTKQKYLTGFERFHEGHFNCAGDYVWPGMPKKIKFTSDVAHLKSKFRVIDGTGKPNSSAGEYLRCPRCQEKGLTGFATYVQSYRFQDMGNNKVKRIKGPMVCIDCGTACPF